MYEDPAKAPMHELIDYTSREKLASKVNQAILRSHGLQAENKLGFFW